MPECPHCGRCTEAPVETKTKQTMIKVELTIKQIEIIKHTAYRAAHGLFCGDSEAMQALIALGLMEYAGSKAFVEEPYFRVTSAGLEIARKL